jgi:quercetin dioxygenase-like cupin family protein
MYMLLPFHCESFVFLKPNAPSLGVYKKLKSKLMNTSLPDYLNDTLTDRAVIFPPGAGEVIHLSSGVLTFKVTSQLSNDQLGVYEINLQAKSTGAKMHFHRFMDETFLINKGILTVMLLGREVEMEEGSVIYIPRFTPHGFRNDSDNATTLTLVFHPGQNREGFFKGLREVMLEQPVDQEKFLRLYHKYDSFPMDEKNMLPMDNSKT